MQTSRPLVLCDAAISVLAESGSRGLTHRAVDRAAGVAEGSTSYYFRTRESLLQAVVERLAELDEAALPSADDGSVDLVVEFVAVVRRICGPGRERQLARYELALEATRRPALHTVLRESSAALRGALASRLRSAAVAAPERVARDLMVLLDGLLLGRVTGITPVRDPDLPETIARLLVAAGVTSGSDAPSDHD